MKDQLITILEAMRLSQVALAMHFQPGAAQMLRQRSRNFANSFKIKLFALAMEALYPNVESSNMSPGDTTSGRSLRTPRKRRPLGIFPN